MEFRVLGPLEVADGGEPLRLGGRKQRLVLAHLLLRANRTVSSATLIDEVWGDGPPEAVRTSLQSYVSNLRRVLGTDRLRGVPGGYRLRAEAGEVDAWRLDALLDQLRGEAVVDPDAAAATVRQALALWRGPALADLCDEQSLVGEIARLEELRLTATEQLVDAELAAGRHAEVIGDLEALIARHRLREGLWSRLMVALYRSGRQAEALVAFQRVRATLAEDLGIDPSPESQALHARILRHDPDLDAPTSTTPSLPAAVPVAVPSALAPPAARRRRPRRIAAMVFAAAVVAVVAVVVRMVDRETTADLLDHAPGIVVLDAASGRAVASIPDTVVRQPVEAIFADGSFWVLNLEPMSFVQIAADSGRVMRQIASPIDNPGLYTVDGDDLWITHIAEPVLSRVSIRRGREIARFENLPGDGGSAGVVVADGSLWVARSDAGDLVRLAPGTGEVEHVVRTLPGSFAVAYGQDGAVWSAGPDGGVSRVDPRTHDVISAEVDGGSYYLATGGGYAWTSDEAAGVVHQVDASGQTVATYPTGLGARALSYSDGTLWVGNQDVGTVSAIDVSTGATTSYSFGHQLTSIAAGDGRVLVELSPARTFDDVVAGLDGDVVTLFADAYQLEPPDPALTARPLARQVWRAACVGLLRHSETGRGNDRQLVPEVAAALPIRSGGGRTYTFTIRSGFRFSPPSGEPLTAETFFATIERALSPQLGTRAHAADLIDDIAGLAEFRAGDADHISGLHADGDTLTITLVAPSDDFLERLNNPLFCPVPLGTPAVPGGASVLIDGGAAEVIVPSAGPYYISHHLNGEYMILARNPNYSGSRPHRLDAIAIREGIDPDTARALVESGEGDGITNLPGVEDQFADRIGCRQLSADGDGIDLEALCLSQPA